MTDENRPTFFSSFPSLELGRMIQNIDRFDTDIPNPEKQKAEAAIEKAEEVTEKIIEDNL